MIKNTTIFLIGNIATKFINFFLIPLYTDTLSTVQYGMVDLISTIGSVMAPMLILNISESVMRFSLDKDAKYEHIISISTIVYLGAMFLGLLVFPLSRLFPNITIHPGYVYFYIITYAGVQILLCYLRGKELLKEYAFGNVIYTFTIAVFNIVFLTKLRLGIQGYFLAMIISAVVTMSYACVVGRVPRLINQFFINKPLAKSMIKYSVVLIPNTFMWWIINASDRIMVSAMVGVAANGIYAISYKLPTLISTITTIFNQAWSYSAIKEEGSADEEKYNNKIFKLLTAFSMMLGIGLITVVKPFMRIYVESSYYDAWKYTPLLTIGCVYLALASFMATTYTVHKDSFGYLYSAILGAIFNILLNFALIPFWGVYGAAFATCISYVVVFVFRVIHTRKYIKYTILTKELVGGSIMLMVTSLLTYVEDAWGMVSQLVIALLAICFYGKIILTIIKRLLGKKKAI